MCVCVCVCVCVCGYNCAFTGGVAYMYMGVVNVTRCFYMTGGQTRHALLLVGHLECGLRSGPAPDR